MKDLVVKEIFMHSPAIMAILFLCGLALVTYVLERLWFYHSIGKIKEDWWRQLKGLVAQNKIKEAISYCVEDGRLFAKIIKSGLENIAISRVHVEETLSIGKERMLLSLRKRLGLFGTLSFVSPLLGLLGTVLGIMQAFNDLALSGSGGPTIVARGISQALVATAAGIIIAVPSAVAYNYFTYRLRDIMSKADTHIQELILAIYGRPQ
ncbi:MAG: MotA/TolQ/ExbB proton channel family protein [Elusimicrobiota bacterium]